MGWWRVGWCLRGVLWARGGRWCVAGVCVVSIPRARLREVCGRVWDVEGVALLEELFGF